LLALLFAPVIQASAILNVDSSGILTGAQNVQVGSKFYNVEFRDGTCVGLIPACDYFKTAVLFTINNLTEATAAGQALVDQVFLNTGLGNFDTNPALTRGCTWATYCNIFSPFELGSGLVNAIWTINAIDDANDGLAPYGITTSKFEDSANHTDSTWAIWSVAPGATVPEPKSIMLLVLGLLAIALTSRVARPN
jgi:hypothetical protein